MISPGTAELALAVAKGLIKFAGNLDRLLAEKVAVQSPLALKLPAVDFSPGPGVIKPRLRAYLQETSEASPGPLGPQKRRQLADLLAEPGPDLAALRRLYALAFADEALTKKSVIQPDANFLQYLRDALPGMRAVLPDSTQSKDPEKLAHYRAAVLAAAFYVDPGADARPLGYPVRIGLLVMDVVAEFGAENTQLFVRHQGLRVIVRGILERFAEPDLETFDEWSPLLRHVLSATLNGVLDARTVWQGSNPWLLALLDALAQARADAGPNGDNFLLGLTRGKGYAQLLGHVLAQSAEVLDDAQAPVFQQVAADVLRAAAPLVKSRPTTFGAFFNDHWADLLHASLVSLDKHGPVLLEGQDPLLRQLLLASLKTLSNIPGAKWLSKDTAFQLADTLIGTFATHPELWKDGLNETWLAEFLDSVLKTIRHQGVASTFSRQGLESITRDALTRFGEHPEWLIQKPGLFQDVVGGILKKVGSVSAFEAQTIASAAIAGSLESVAAHPALINSDYARVMADFAGQLAALVQNKSLTALQASDFAQAAAQAALLNPNLFASASTGLTGLITSAVLETSQNHPSTLIAGTTLVALQRELLHVFALRGLNTVQSTPVNQLRTQLIQLLEAGLSRAEKELGRRLALPALPPALAALAGAWLRGSVSTLDPEQPVFKELFAQLAEQSAAEVQASNLPIGP